MSEESRPPAANELTRVMEYQRVIEDFTRTATGILSEGELLHHASAVVSGVTGVSKTKVLRYRPQEGDLLIIAGVGWQPGVIGCVSLPLDITSPAGRALQTGTAVTSSNIMDDPEFAYSPVLRDHNVISMFNVPVRQNGAIWGVFEVDSERPRVFDKIDIAFLSTYANILGLAVSKLEAERLTADAAAEASRQASLHKMVVRELNHRVRNNFQLISSFLGLQRSGATDDARERLTRAMERVQAVSLAHDQLSLERSGDLEFGAYLKALCANIDPQRREIELVVSAPKVTMTVDRAVPAGLIVNELVTNAIKHAFTGEPRQGPGNIHVSLAVDAQRGEATIAVEDDGTGMGEARPEGKGAGLGLALIRAFAGQIGGRVEKPPRERGTCVQVTFPLPPR